MTELKIEQLANERLAKIKNARPCLKITGTAYYVSNEGDDNADGLSPETAWKTIERVNRHNAQYKEGDAVLFRSGDIFRGHIELRSITYSSYGEGEKPHIYGSPFNAAEKEWVNEGNDIYSLKVAEPRPFEEITRNEFNDIGNLVFNNGEAHAIKKWNNIGCDCEFDLDFYHDNAGGKIYLKSTKGAPNERFDSIELSVKHQVFHGMSVNCCGATVDGLIIKYSGGSGIGLDADATPLKNFTVRNCEFEWIGGSVMALSLDVLYGNAFEIWGGSENVLIENCYFNQTYDAAVTDQWYGFSDRVQVKDFVVKGCLFERNTYDFEYFLSHFEEGTQKKDGKHILDTNVKFVNISFEDNICRRNGYGFGAQREYKFEARSIRCGTHANLSKNFVIKNNIFDRSTHFLVGIYSRLEDNLPVLKGNTYCQHVGKGFIERQLVKTSFYNETINNPDTNFAEKDAKIIFAQRPLDY